MDVGSLVRRKPSQNIHVKIGSNQIGIVVRIGKSGYWDYEVLWSYGIWTHDESELEEINESG